MNKRDIQTVPSFLWEGGDGLLSLLAPELPQTSTFVPFEGKPEKRHAETKWAERTRGNEVFAFNNGFHP
ncbi:hypothetical protein M3629_26700 [Paenibacillus polysaccharolyticus]|nr:hypothetical protein [Paenibacillus polysaccharolyticus]